MLVSALKKSNEYDYVELRINNTVPDVDAMQEDLNGFHEGHNLINGKKLIHQDNFINGSLFSKYCEPRLNSYKANDQNIFNGYIFGNVDDKNLPRKDEVRQLSKKIAVNLGWDSDEENKWNDMSKGSEPSSAVSSRSYPTRFSPETVTSVCLNGDGSNDDSSIMSEESDSSRRNGVMGPGASKLNATLQSGLPTTSKNVPQVSRMQISTDDEPNFDIFDLMCTDEEVADCAQLFSEKDELSANGDLVNKYENNLGLDIVKDKNVCWADGNFDSEVCPLRSYDACNENSLWSFSKENLESESRESFSQGWAFDESIENVSQDQIPEAQIIVPKKTVDITKIKGWRKKQFTVEKCLANCNSVLKKSCWISNEAKDTSPNGKFEDGIEFCDGNEEQNKDYAFVCDRLDDFLDQEAELKINYEIPHLYAECGIKLTSEELVSRPKFMNETKSPHLKRPNQPSVPPTTSLHSTATSVKLDAKKKKPTKCSPGKKPSPKSNSALSTKSQSQWNVIKENSGPKDKPISLLKKENFTKKVSVPPADAVVPCRRSTRTQQHSALCKSKPRANDEESSISNRVKVEVCSVNSLETITREGPSFNFHPDYRLTIRKFGMVLYPGPFAPLNPFIRYHLQKIRSYQTLIDKKWAKFAVSAVVVKGKPRKRRRMILPVTCCFKYKVESETDRKQEEPSNECSVSTAKIKSAVGFEDEEMQAVQETVENLANLVCDEMDEDKKPDIATKPNEDVSYIDRVATDTLSKDTSECATKSGAEDAKEEDVKDGDGTDNCSRDVDKRINNGEMDNLDCYVEEVNGELDVDVIHVGDDVINAKDKVNVNKQCSNRTGLGVRSLPNRSSKLSNPLVPHNSKKMTFDRNITKLLGKKLNQIKSSQKANNSIDELKSVKPSALELIKLAFVKENFLSGYINLWYDKGESGRKSRVFLTFSMNPPVEGAINFKMVSRFSRNDLPNIINEIITKENLVDSNDFAILYCDGKLWEILGSVNIGLGKSESEVAFDEKVQVFHLMENVLPELKLLRQVKPKNERNKVVKWWVMHMMQDYTDVLIKMGDEVGRISRSVIMKTWKTKVPSYIEFKGLTNKRPMGIAINPRLWPYFLIGPYYVNDQHGLSLKLDSEIVPFEYYLPLDRIKPKFHLKRFVSWVIMHSWRNCRQVIGMWLYDRVASNQSTFIEVKTKVKKTGNYEPKVEHDYSLSQGQDEQFEARFDCVPKAKGIEDDKNVNLSSEDVFLVPNIPNLGYIKGLLHPDHSVTIDHPLKPGRKIKSHHIFDWLNKLIKRRIRFIPNDLDIKWSIVKNAELLSSHKPLDRFSLGGTHIICQKGLFYLLSMTKEKIRSLGLDESFVMDTIMKNPIIQEVMELKKLGQILLLNDESGLNMSEVLQLALTEITKLEREEVALRDVRVSEERERRRLCQRYVKALENCGIDENAKKAIRFYIKRILDNRRNGKQMYTRSKMISENFQCLFSIGKFVENSLKSLKDFEDSDKSSEKSSDRKSPEVELIDESEASPDSEKISFTDNEIVQQFESKIKTFYEILKNSNTNDTSLHEELKKRLNTMSQHLKKLKSDAKNQGVAEKDLRTDSQTADVSHCQGSSECDSVHMRGSKCAKKEKAGADVLVEDLLRSHEDKTCCNRTDEAGTREEEEDSFERVVSNVAVLESVGDTLDPAEIKTENRLPALTNFSTAKHRTDEERMDVEATGESAESVRSPLFEVGEVDNGPSADATDGIAEVESSTPKREAEFPQGLNYSGGLKIKVKDVEGLCKAQDEGSEVLESLEVPPSEPHDKVTGAKSNEVRRGRVGEEDEGGRGMVTSDSSIYIKPCKDAVKCVDNGEGKRFRKSLKKTIKVKLLGPKSFSDAITIEELSRRGVDTTGNRKQVIVIKKRKNSGECHYDFFKKLRSS